MVRALALTLAVHLLAGCSTSTVERLQSCDETGCPAQSSCVEGSCAATRAITSGPPAVWREEGALEFEVMSPRLSGVNTLSTITLRSLADVGYVVAPDARADPFRLSRVVGALPAVRLQADVDRGPIYRLGVEGSLTRVR